ncbi:hypothetical protein K6W16_19465 [Burkholderia dolosa]|uniref:Uncharacterized protein n=1 Tax=Burkholderia dolosa TaxID=152500 RepID=A0A892IEM2_9BURK|nr:MULTISPECIES: hypothetical protein [Burkholderia]AJY11169.1 hypothetical protein AK34_5600 [Burkholderia dolosa AU0158]MBR8317124.1 hypothetical protein [Burkholderia dolosa]MBR8418849.1 hypothetical protein [Burkholderia dolosa]MBY4659360.1 hypothetical protein [Burkholderia dolosa]MBY4690491.1 hypothetical protein [Burkholderia dolosa]
MKEFLLILTAVSIWGGVWRFAASQWAKRGHGKVVRNFGGAGGGFIAASIFLMVFLPAPHQDASAKKAEPGATASASVAASAMTVATASAPAAIDSPANSEPEKIEATLDFTPKEYQDRFNKVMRELDLPFRANLKIEPGKGNLDTAQTRLNDHLAIMASVDKKSGKLTGVLMIGEGDGSFESGANVLMIGTASMIAAVPNGTTKTVGPEVLKLMREFETGSDKPSSRILNGVRLSHTRTPGVATMFAAEPA